MMALERLNLSKPLAEPRITQTSVEVRFLVFVVDNSYFNFFLFLLV